MKIAVVGSRGIPSVQGGIETHCEKLYPRLAAKGHNITVYGAATYLGTRLPYEYKGIQVVPLRFVFRFPGLEAFVRTLFCLSHIFKTHPDIVHIHGIGPAFFAPLFRLTGAKVVYTHHGCDYARAKWGFVAKTALKIGECFGCLCSNKIIVISKYIQANLLEKYKCKKTELIYNGVEISAPVPNAEIYLRKYGIEKGKYIFACGRFVEEKCFNDLIAAFVSAHLEGYKLVLAGSASPESAYSRKLEMQAKAAGVILTGFIKGDELSSIYANTALFVLPSAHEGLPIVLLEAMSYGLNIIASDIPANVEVPIARDSFFKVRDVHALAGKMKSVLAKMPNSRVDYLELIQKQYNWNLIASQTERLYAELIR
ncbi:MAG: glycosyltransferase family 4 protein [Fibrobacteraceae bacterium]|nr:glycosyltransferase family 4 protein [Fibrobacteraceae bacterium]